MRAICRWVAEATQLVALTGAGISTESGIPDFRGAAEQADVLLAIGTGLQVYPVASAVPIAKAAGARVIIVNAEPTPFDDIADAVLRQPIGDVLPEVCQ